MTKYEMLGHDENGKKLSPNEIFELERVHLRWRIASLISSVSVSLFESRLFSYNQRRELEQLVEQLSELHKKLEKWDYFGEKSQMNLDFSKTNN